jgi:ribosomal protein L11 methyltransferase
MKHIEIKITTSSAEQNEILIALLADIGFEGFEENENDLKAFVPQTKFDKETLDAVAGSNNLPYTVTVIEQQNWNAQWESSFDPVVVNNFAAVRAGFHQPVKNVQHEIIITPKMSFGTGHHATTYLMMEQMSQLIFTDKSVLDFGTGTGVLSILAKKMGASAITAIDNDDWSIENAKENIITNNSRNILLQKAASIPLNQKYDIILANINLNVILQNMPLIAKACKPGTKILLSGFLITDEIQVRASLTENGIIFTSFTHQKDWICVDAKYRTD